MFLRGGLPAIVLAVSIYAASPSWTQESTPESAPQTETSAPNSQAPQTPGARSGGRTGAAQAASASSRPDTAATAAVPRTPPAEKTVVTQHSARIGGATINYTATTGTLIIKADDGTPKATFFYVAYSKDGVTDPASRPVSFVYNGGPGSGSLFTHMGMGPKRTVLTPDGHGMPGPYKVTDNEDSFLDETDLVFIDAISTGYSRAVPGENASQFYGVIPDATAFSDFIYQYLTRAERWSSPKFLIGESYGTTRSAELSGVLQHRHEIYLNGIVLVSSVAFSDFGADEKSAFFLPTYITSAWYHHLLAPDLQAESMEQIAETARTFAQGEYSQTIEKGDLATPAEYSKTVADMARLTALSPRFIEESNLRVSPQRWFKELERDKRRTVGRLDSRFEGYDVDAAGEREEYDPSEASYEGAYAATFQDYVRRDLKWQTDGYYTITANVRPWNETGSTQVAEVLRSAMTQESDLKVLVVCGYYDLATPFNGIEHTVQHMHLEPALRKNISFSYYEAGHMVYIDRKAHDKLHKDVDDFIRASFKP
jgi:carboxypeptidase C (cathepsin A)